MRILIAAVGRLRDGPEQALLQEYLRRVKWSTAVREVEERRPLPTPARMAREAELLLGTVPDGAVMVALDERGRTLSSQDFATRLGTWRDQGTDCLAFLIGGADGHDARVRERADLVLSLGAMTWPHFLVRVLLAEQIFRAQSLLEGHPYHRG
ncbi:MAG: 23S rRNA (pseudouridine(1915)-N(3))-methyltransferase RlmH [Alphaproteobacteria bacterium]